jgi:cell wall-associated NlpC family hydrolase
VIPRIIFAIFVSLLVGPAHVWASDAVDFAASLIGRPYVWGAEGPHSFDCSGLTQYVYQKFGVDLPRRAISQSQVGDRVGRRWQRGDLLFFSTDPGDSLVTHVGIYEGNGVMIDASKRHGRVRRDNIRDDYWVDRLLFGRRVSDGIDDGDDRVVVASRRPTIDKGQAARRVIETLAGVLIRRARR